MEEAKQCAIEIFKQSKEFNISLDKSYEDSYDKGIEFFNIWCKRHEVDFAFFGKEFKSMIEDREDKEKTVELNANTPPSPVDSEGCTIIEKPFDDTPSQPPKVTEEAQSQALEP